MFKPEGYNSLSPYLIVDEAEKLVTLLKSIFNAQQLRRFDREDGTIAHVELQIDDSILMLSSSTKQFPANTTILHLYVPNVNETFQKAIAHGCTLVEEPKKQDNDPDQRGSFLDFAGNFWSVSTQY